MLLYLIVILWSVEQVAVQRFTNAAFSDYALGSVAIAFVAGCVSLIIAASPAPVGSVVAGVLAAHAIATTPLLFMLRERRAGVKIAPISSPAARKQMPF